MLTVSTEEQPLISLEEGEALYEANQPLPPADEGSKELQALEEFSSKVELILQTVNDKEYFAAATFMKPPFEEYKKPVTYPSIGSVVGKFAGRKAALIQTDVGTYVGTYLQDAI